MSVPGTIPPLWHDDRLPSWSDGALELEPGHPMRLRYDGLRSVWRHRVSGGRGAAPRSWRIRAAIRIREIGDGQ